MSQRQPPKAQRNARGFTLLELSVVLAIIAVVAGASLVTLVGNVQASAVNATVARMDAINKALLDYRVTFNRLPCPSDLTLTSSSANYGMEAGAGSGSSIAVGTGACTGGGMLPQANFTGKNGATGDVIAEGAVPTRALRLPDSAMYDGWGRRFNYAVDVTMTATSAFTTATILPASCAPAVISVTDASDVAGSRTTSAVYALVSHGANGHGGYTSNGVPLNAGSVNADEQTNCHCNSSGAATSYTPTYVEKLATVDTANALDNFDDIVTFRALWQMQTPSAQMTPGPCAYLAISAETSPYLFLYQFNNGQFTLLPAPAVIPTSPAGGGGSVVISHDNTTLAFTDSSDCGGRNGGTYLYNITPAGLVYSASFGGSGSLGTNCGGGGAMAPDKSYYITSTGIYGNLVFNVWSGSTYTPAGATVSPSGFVPPTNNIGSANSTPQISSDGSTMYFRGNLISGGSDYYLWVFTRSGSTFTLYNPTGSSSPPYTIDLSSAPYNSYQGTNTFHLDPSGQYLNMGAQFIIKNANTASPTILGPANGLSAFSWNNGVAWSPNGQYLVQDHDCATGISIYSLNKATDTFTTVLNDNSNCPMSACVGPSAAWSPDGNYVVLTSQGNTVSCMWKRSGNSFSWVPPNVSFPNAGFGMTFTH